MKDPLAPTAPAPRRTLRFGKESGHFRSIDQETMLVLAADEPGATLLSVRADGAKPAPEDGAFVASWPLRASSPSATPVSAAL